MEKATGTLIDQASKVSPFGYEVYGFVIVLLVVMIIALAFQYRKKEKLIEDLTTKAIEAITLFMHQTSPEVISERNRLLVMEIKDEVREAIQENKNGS